MDEVANFCRKYFKRFPNLSVIDDPFASIHELGTFMGDHIVI